MSLKKDWSVPTQHEALCKSLLSGVREVFAKGASLKVDGVKQTREEIERQLSRLISLESAPRTLHISLESAVAAKLANDQTSRDYVHALVAAVRGDVGKDDKETLAKFGIVVTVPRQLSAEEKAARIAKARATRAKRDGPQTPPAKVA